MRFHGKVVTVTGAASGIGLEIARRFAEEGARVVLSDVARDRLEKAVQEIARIQEGSSGVPADVTRPADLVALVEAARAAHGRLDVHVNNAGIAVPGEFDAITDEEMERHILVNLLGVMHGTRAAARLMRAQAGGGHIVNIASLAGISPVPGAAAYAASKWGVRGYTLTCAFELRDTPVRLSTVCPDAVETPLLDPIEQTGAAPIILSGGSPLSPRRVADAVLDIVERPRREVCLPAWRGALARVGTLFPSFSELLFPFFEKKGRDEIARRRAGGTSH
jgi:3-oxoacyl-[acyl-carrier protein] reductase